MGGKALIMSKLKENLKDLFTDWNTIPNWMCFVRIALIPVFAVLFIKEYYLWAVITMIVAALTDVFDGKNCKKIQYGFESRKNSRSHCR